MAGLPVERGQATLALKALLTNLSAAAGSAAGALHALHNMHVMLQQLLQRGGWSPACKRTFVAAPQQ